MVGITTSVTALVMGMTDSYLVTNLYTKDGWNLFYNDLNERSEILVALEDRNSIFFKFLTSMLTLVQLLIMIPSVVLVPYIDLFVLLVPFCVRRIMKEFSQFCKNSMGSPIAAERASF